MILISSSKEENENIIEYTGGDPSDLMKQMQEEYLREQQNGD